MIDSAIRLLVEPAHLSDIDLVAPLFDSYRQFYGAPPDLPAARDFLEARLARGESVVLMAILESEDGGNDAVAGFAQLYPSFSSLALARTMVLNDLFVAPEYRRLGVARRLVEEYVEYARRACAVRIELATQLTDGNALALYESEGFARDTEFVHLERALNCTVSVQPPPRRETPAATVMRDTISNR
jgi:ribosomal protein S18 acetylase RimI-like enzyme